MRIVHTARWTVITLLAIVCAALLLAGCSGGNLATNNLASASGPSASPTPSSAPNPAPTPNPSPNPNPAPSPTPAPPAPSPTPQSLTVPRSSHVVVVVEENHNYSSVVGSSSMPYFNSLAKQNVLLTQYYANTHPSIGNYFMMTTGQIVTNNDSFTGVVSVDNIVRHLLTAGQTWKSYAQGLPSVGYTGGNTGAYLQRHNPFSYLSDVVNSSAQKLNLVPFTQFAADLANNQLPNFSFVVPDANNDAHNGTLAQADAWLQTNIAPLLNNPAFQKDGILIIVFDEASTSDSTHGGGRVAALVAGPLAKKGFQSTALYQHQNLLRTVLDALGVTSYPGAAAAAADMADAF